MSPKVDVSGVFQLDDIYMYPLLNEWVYSFLYLWQLKKTTVLTTLIYFFKEVST